MTPRRCVKPLRSRELFPPNSPRGRQMRSCESLVSCSHWDFSLSIYRAPVLTSTLVRYGQFRTSHKPSPAPASPYSSSAPTKKPDTPRMKDRARTTPLGCLTGSLYKFVSSQASSVLIPRRFACSRSSEYASSPASTGRLPYRLTLCSGQPHHRAIP